MHGGISRVERGRAGVSMKPYMRKRGGGGGSYTFFENLTRSHGLSRSTGELRRFSNRVPTTAGNIDASHCPSSTTSISSLCMYVTRLVRGCVEHSVTLVNIAPYGIPNKRGCRIILRKLQRQQLKSHFTDEVLALV